MWHFKNPIRHEIPATRWPGADEAARALLFQPIRVGSLRSASRTWVPAMVPWRATGDGFVTPDNLDWYRRFAEGQPGAIVVEATGVRDIASGPLLRIGHDRYTAGLRELVETVRRASDGQTRLFIQLIDFLSVKRRPDKSKFFERFLALEHRHARALAEATGDDDWPERDETRGARRFSSLRPTKYSNACSTSASLNRCASAIASASPTPTSRTFASCRKCCPASSADAARRAREAGFDGVELHYAHAYTMASFLSARNNRTDGYGGTREHRVRLPLEVYGAVRERVGADLRGRRSAFSATKSSRAAAASTMPSTSDASSRGRGSTIFRSRRAASSRMPRSPESGTPSTRTRGRAVTSVCRRCCRTRAARSSRSLPLVVQIKRAVNEAGFSTPVVATGGIATFEQAEAILQRGEADIIGAARQTLADPDWFLKVRLGRGDEGASLHLYQLLRRLSTRRTSK